MKRRRNYDGKDRISDLPDCILLEILSHLQTKQTVKMSILSPRWKNLWKHISVLSFNHINFQSLEIFTRFVSKVLSLRNHKTSLQAFNFECHDFIKPRILKRIMKYLSSHNVQQLHMTLVEFPLCNFSSHTLTSLRLTSCEHRPLFPNSLKLPALINLSIEFFLFRVTSDDDYAEPFSVFKSLNTLIIHHCGFFNPQKLSELNLFISSVSLVNLTISMRKPSLKFKLSTPNLSSFEFEGHPLQNLGGFNSSFSSIKHVKIVLPFSNRHENFHLNLFNWLVELALMESLTISLKTLQILNLIPDSWKIDFHYLHNLKLLKIDAHEDDLSSPHDGIEDFLLQNAPLAKKVINYEPRSAYATACRLIISRIREQKRIRDQNISRISRDQNMRA